MNHILTYWNWQPCTILGMVLLSALFLKLWNFRPGPKAVMFVPALALLVICLLSPLQVLASEYLFSMHMAVHVILLLVIGPFLTLSLPERLPAFLSGFFNFFSRNLWLAWFTGVGVMWFWHIPFVFNSMADHSSAAHEWIHGAETLSLLPAGMIFSYPVLRQRENLHPLAGIIYLASACVFCSLLGLMITFAPAGIYSHYLSGADPLHINNIIQNDWNVSRQEDQQAAGMIMWVPCCMLYAAGSILIFKEWIEEKEASGTGPQPESTAG